MVFILQHTLTLGFEYLHNGSSSIAYLLWVMLPKIFYPILAKFN